MAESIKQRLAAMPNHSDVHELRALMDALFVDLTAIRTDLTAARAAILLITAKLDADGGVTDTNYASTCNPAAQSSLTLIA